MRAAGIIDEDMKGRGLFFGPRDKFFNAGSLADVQGMKVSLGSAGSEQAKQSRYGDDEYSHGLPYAYRQPDWGAV